MSLSVNEAAAIAQREVIACYETVPAKDEALVESSLVPADQPREAVEEVAAWLQHVDRLDEIPGARISLPERNVLWDAAEAIRHRFGG